MVKICMALERGVSKCVARPVRRGWLVGDALFLQAVGVGQEIVRGAEEVKLVGAEVQGIREATQRVGVCLESAIGKDVLDFQAARGEMPRDQNGAMAIEGLFFRAHDG